MMSVRVSERREERDENVSLSLYGSAVALLPKGGGTLQTEREGRREGGKEGRKEEEDNSHAPELLFQLSDAAVLNLVVDFEELKGDEDDNSLGLAHIHLLGSCDVEILQVCLPLGVVALFRRESEGVREVGARDGEWKHG